MAAASFAGVAQACTILTSPHPPGSREAIAEQRKQDTETAERITEHQVVFVGKTVKERMPVLGEILAGEFGLWGGDVPGVRSWFEPMRTLKGKPDQPTISVLSGFYGSTCGYGPSLKPGELVIVYASRRSGHWLGGFASVDILPYVESALR